MTVDPAVNIALSLVDGLDNALAAGLARLVPEQRAALTAFANAFAGSPLGGSVTKATEAIIGGDCAAHHLVALAAGRAALLGTVADALLASTGVPLAPVETTPAPVPSAEQKPRLEGIKQWLVEIALAGFGQLDAATIAPIFQTLTSLQQTPGVGRLSALATGFARELLDNAPTSSLAELPKRRWADLWCRALLGTVVLPEGAPTIDVTGKLHVLGADVRHHDHLVSVVIHSVFDGRFVRTTLSAWKVDAIAGADVWNLIRPKAPQLVAALAAPAVLTVSGTLASTGELTVQSVTNATPFDPFTLDLSAVAYTPPAPRDRHPIQIAIPRLNADVPLDLSRASPLLDLTEDLKDAAAVFGLLRWDESWKFQPLLVKSKKGKLAGANKSIADAEKVKADARAVLTERASKLLRVKS